MLTIYSVLNVVSKYNQAGDNGKETHSGFMAGKVVNEN
jgi:hypothetical protein